MYMRPLFWLWLALPRFVDPASLPHPHSPLLGHFHRSQGDQDHQGDDLPRDVTASHEAIAACRAACTEKTLDWPPTNDACLATKDCLDCWEMCSNLYTEEYKWRPMCSEGQPCAEGLGCSIACTYSFTDVSMPEVLPMAFPVTPTTNEVSSEQLVINWQTPQHLTKDTASDVTSHHRVFLIYTLFFRDDGNPQWTRVITTMEHFTSIDGPHASFHGLQFLLLASSSTGTVARDEPPYPGTPSAVTSSPDSDSQPSPSNKTPAPPPPAPPSNHKPAAPFDQFPAKMSGLSVQVLSSTEGKLEAELTWNQHLPTPDTSTSGQQFIYSVKWTLVSCNVDANMPVCHLRDTESFHINVKATHDQNMRLVLTGLVYNSEYSLEMGFKGSDTSDQRIFFTPACSTVDATYRTCIPPTSPPTSPTTSPTTTKTTAKTEMPTSTATPAPTKTTKSSPRRSTEDPIQNILPYLMQSHKKDKLTGSLPLDVILLSAGVTFGVFFLMLVIYLVYRRCYRPNPDPNLQLAKALQSYSHLPLLDTSHMSTPRSLSNSLHHLSLPHNMGTPTSRVAPPTHHLATPTSHHGTPTHLMMSSPQLHQFQYNQMLSNGPHPQPMITHPWHSMDVIPTPPCYTSDTSADATPTPTPTPTPHIATPTSHTLQSARRSIPRIGESLVKKAVQQAMSNKQDTMVNIDTRGSARVTAVHHGGGPGIAASRSVECLKIPSPDVKRSSSIADLSPNSQLKTARRQINFATKPHPLILVSPPPVEPEQDGEEPEGEELQLTYSPHLLQTVYEEGWGEESGEAGILDEEQGGERFGEVLEWDYNITSQPFNHSIQTM